MQFKIKIFKCTEAKVKNFGKHVGKRTGEKFLKDAYDVEALAHYKNVDGAALLYQRDEDIAIFSVISFQFYQGAAANMTPQEIQSLFVDV